jgi:hypothetical protein
MKTRFRILILTVSVYTLLLTNVYSQDSNAVALPTDGPKRLTFESGILFDQQTVQMQPSKTLEFVLQHRFSSIENGITDLFGIYGTANISLGLNYNLTDYLMVGFHTVKNRKLQNFQYKVKLLSETKSGSMPVSVVWFGNVVIDAREKTIFGMDYTFSSRLSYFNQLLIAKKFNDHFSMQIAPSFSHYNMVEKSITSEVNTAGDTVKVDKGFDHDKFGLSIIARYKFTPQISVVVGYDHPFYIKSLSEHNELLFESEPNLTFGFEVATSTHAFHIYLGTANNIVPQEVMMANSNDYSKKNFIFGFNLTRLWNF